MRCAGKRLRTRLKKQYERWWSIDVDAFESKKHFLRCAGRLRSPATNRPVSFRKDYGSRSPILNQGYCQLESSEVLMFSLLVMVASGHAQGAQGFAPVPCEAGKEGRQERRASTRSEANTRAAERDRASSRPETMGAQETLASHSFTASSAFVSCAGNMLNNSQPTHR